MSKECSIIAVGKYSDDIKNYLEYHSEFYRCCTDSTEIITECCLVGTLESTQLLAHAVGISDYHDLSQQAINPDNINWDDLEDITELVDDDIIGLKLFVNHNFKLYLHPLF